MNMFFTWANMEIDPKLGGHAIAIHFVVGPRKHNKT